MIDTAKIERLVADLGSADRGVQRGAAAGLAALGVPAIPPLIDALNSPNIQVQAWAPLVLGRIGEPALVPLIKPLKRGTSEVRQGAVLALGEMDNADVLSLLVDTLDDSDAGVQATVVQAVGRYAQRTGDEEAYVLMRQMLEHQNGYVRLKAAEWYVRTRAEGAIPLLTELLTHDAYYVRQTAVDALGMFVGSVEAMDALRHAVEDEDVGVRIRAESMLQRVGGSAR